MDSLNDQQKLIVAQILWLQVSVVFLYPDGEQNDFWTRFMSEILDDPEGILTESLNQEINDPDMEDSALSLLSSGQAILVHFVTSLLAWLEPNSLVLFDDPESHLHSISFLAVSHVTICGFCQRRNSRDPGRLQDLHRNWWSQRSAFLETKGTGKGGRLWR